MGETYHKIQTGIFKYISLFIRFMGYLLSGGAILGMLHADSHINKKILFLVVFFRGLFLIKFGKFFKNLGSNGAKKLTDTL